MKETLTRRELFYSLGIGAASVFLVGSGCAIHTQGRQERNKFLLENNLPLPETPAETVMANAEQPKIWIGGILVALGITGLGALASTFWETRRIRQTTFQSGKEPNME